MNKDFVLKFDDKVFYKFGNNNKKSLIISGSDGETIEEFERIGYKVIKVERPKYTTVYEAPKEILDKDKQ